MINGQMNIVTVPAARQPVTQETGMPVEVAMDGAVKNGGDFAELLSGVQMQVKLQDLSAAGHVKTSQGNAPSILDTGADDPVVDLLAQLNVPSLVSPASESDVQKMDDAEKTDVSADAVLPVSEPADVTAQIVLAAYSQPGRMPEVNIPPQTSVDRLQKAVVVTESAAMFLAPTAEKQAKQVAAEPLPQPDVAGSVPTAAQQPIKYERMPDVNIPTPLPVDRLQNVAPVTDLPASSFLPDNAQSEPVAAVPVRTSVTDSAKTVTVIASLEQLALSETKTAELLSVTAEKPVLVSMTPEPKLSASLPATSPESEIEIHLSQPVPITARETAPSVLADKRPAAIAQEKPASRQPLNPELQLEKVRTASETSVAREMDSSLQVAGSTGESSLDEETSSGGSNQGHSDGASANQTLAQNVSGQLKTEHQRDAAPSAKAGITEPARQEISGQVMQQVKERLVHQDLKPGSQQITLTLSPDSLGELKMNLNLQGQKLSVEIITENRSVRDVIVQHTDALKESLARQNITMESFDVTTGGKGSGNQGQNQNAWRELAKQQQQLWTSPRGYQTAQADLPSGQAAYQGQQGQSMLDIHY